MEMVSENCFNFFKLKFLNSTLHTTTETSTPKFYLNELFSTGKLCPPQNFKVMLRNSLMGATRKAPLVVGHLPMLIHTDDVAKLCFLPYKC